MIWDTIWLTVLWFTLTGLRIWIREVWTLDLIAGNPILEEVEFRTHAPLVIPIVVCWVLWLYRLGAYRVLAGLDLRRLIGASALALCTLLALLFSVQATDVLSRSLYFGFALACAGPVLWAERRVLMWLQKTGVLPSSSQRILLVGDTKESLAYRQLLAADPPQGIEVIQDVVAHPDPVQTQSLHQLSQALDVQVVDHVLVGPGWTNLFVWWREPVKRWADHFLSTPIFSASIGRDLIFRHFTIGDCSVFRPHPMMGLWLSNGSSTSCSRSSFC